jgi:uncharacterized repeat protein (TIGR03803 family)
MAPPSRAALTTPPCADRGGCGNVYRMDATGKETALYQFNGTTSGVIPLDGGLILDSQGNLYGTTDSGGDLRCNAPVGCGTVFKLAANGSYPYTVLYSFHRGTGAIGGAVGLVRDPSGNLYGAAGGGTAGTVFKVEPSGAETVLYRFTGGADGSLPLSGLVRDAQGNLYGAAEFGGDEQGQCASPGGCGVIFKLDTTGAESTVYTFTGGQAGYQPLNVILDAAGNFYGITLVGGSLNCMAGCGTVFKVDTSGKETVLHVFTGGTTDGYYPVGGLVHDSAGNLYGTTTRGGAFGLGTIFKVDAAGNETIVQSFTGGSDGSTPFASLIMDSAGNIYGTTSAGGDPNCHALICGVIFKIVP